MKDIFISYAYVDSQEVETLVSKIFEGFDFNKDVINPAENITTVIKGRLKKANAVLVFVSTGSLHSEWVAFEMGAAQALNKKIIPVIIDGMDMPDNLKGLQYVDARSKQQREIVEEIKKALTLEI